jgi:hypothetical protein
MVDPLRAASLVAASRLLWTIRFNAVIENLGPLYWPRGSVASRTLHALLALAAGWVRLLFEAA